MIFFCDNSGAIFKTVPEKVYQGSVNANVIYFVGAFDGDCVVTVRFELPNGLLTTEKLLSSSYTELGGDIQMENGISYNVWEYVLKSDITALSGTVGVQFTITSQNENGMAATVCTARSTFDVEKGVPVLQDDSFINYETLLTQIKAVLTALQLGDTENSIASAASAEAARISAENAEKSEQQALAAQESAQASAESASQSETIAAGAAAQIQGYIKQTEQNTLNITNIQAVLQGNSQYAEITVSEAYTSRVTANGANIFDGQLTPVESIKGCTVRYNDTLKNANINSIVSTGKNLFNTKNDVGGYRATAEVVSASGFKCIAEASGTSYVQFYNKLIVGKTYTIFVRTNTTELSGNLPQVILSSGINAQRIYSTLVKITTSWKKTTFTADVEDLYLLAYGLLGGSTLFQVMLVEGEYTLDTMPDFEDYIEYTYQLPQTVELAEYDIINPPEQTLTRYTETIVFETTSDYWEMTSNGVFRYTGDLPDIPDLTQTGGFGVCNLFDPVSSQNPNGSWGIGVDGYFVVIKQDINSLEDFLSYLQTQETNGNPLMLSYKTAEPVSSVTFAIQQSYEVYKGGTETIVQGTTDNSAYGAKPTITQTYLGKVGE